MDEPKPKSKEEPPADNDGREELSPERKEEIERLVRENKALLRRLG